MHQAVFEAFESICKERGACGRVLEVGAVPTRQSLLNLPALGGASEKIGVNLDPPGDFADYRIVQANANDLGVFADAWFDTVICNAVLEHDRFFWRSLAEFRRVTRSGGLIILGVPGFQKSGLDRCGQVLMKTPLLRRLRKHPLWNCLFYSTLTFMVHDYPGDYYRFSPQAVEEVLFEGMKHVQVLSIMTPPRLIGSGIRP